MIRRQYVVGGLATVVAAISGQQAAAVTMNVNVARGGNASQSSTLVNPANPGAGKAIDGGLGTGFNLDATTTHTLDAANSFWMVDLGATRDLSSVELFNRGDCCDNRLSNFRLSVLDSSMTEVYGQNVGPAVPPTSQLFTLPGGTEGRFVKVQLNGLNGAGNGVLSLREVVIMGEQDVLNGSNVARQFGTAVQSSTLNNSGAPGAHRAIDGNTSGSFTQVEATQTITHSNSELTPSWTVDLNSTFHVDHIRIYERTDCCSDRLRNFTLTLFDKDNNPVHVQNVPGHVTGYINIAIPSGVQAESARIQLNSEGVARTLEISEFQVYGGGLQNVARNPLAVATQSSTRIGSGANVASAAIDGNTEGDFFLNGGSVTHTNTQDNPWWQVDMGREFVIDEIVLHNRTDGGLSIQDRLGGFFLEVLNSLGTQVFSYTGPSSVGAGPVRVEVPDILGQTVRVTLPGTGRILSLAEVQVFGAALPEPASAALLGLGGLALLRRRRLA